MRFLSSHYKYPYHFPKHLSHFPHTFPTYFPQHLIPVIPRPLGNSNTLFQSMLEFPTENILFRRTFPTYLFSNEEEVLSHPFVCLIFYLLIPAIFCCTHSPILRRKCSSIFIPLMVNCLINSYALLSFSLSVWFSAFNTSFSRFRHSFSYLRSSILSKYACSRSPEFFTG